MSEKEELLAILMMGASTILWPLGGWRWKPFRRYILPFVMGILLWFYSHVLWQTILSSVLLCAVAHLPYGERTPWFKPNQHGSKAITAVAYTLPSFVWGMTAWQLITPSIFLLTFYLSNTKFFGKDFTWKICEGILGFSIAATMVAAMRLPWFF